MDLWAIAALRSLRDDERHDRRSASRHYDRLLTILVRLLVVFTAIFIFVVGRAVLRSLPVSLDERAAWGVAGAVALIVLILLWFGLPPLLRVLERRFRAFVETGVANGWMKNWLMRLFKQDPYAREFSTLLFTGKAVLLDALILMYAIAKMATLALRLVGVRLE